jgi:hypothetical protein
MVNRVPGKPLSQSIFRIHCHRHGEIKDERATNAQDEFIAFDSFLLQATQTMMDRVK